MHGYEKMLKSNADYYNLIVAKNEIENRKKTWIAIRENQTSPSVKLCK